MSIKRFKNFGAAGAKGQSKLFTGREQMYCRGFKDSALHFAGLFAAKEAASKALGTKRHPFLSLEIRHDSTGQPYVCTTKNKRLPVAISISHDGEYAIAIALAHFGRTR